MSIKNEEIEVDEINLDDIDGAPEKVQISPAKLKQKALLFLPQELRQAADKLPVGKQHTVLDLPPEGDGHNSGLLKIASTCFKMGVGFDETLLHLQEVYDVNRIDYETAPERAVERIWHVEGDIEKIIGDEDNEAFPKAKDEMLLRFRRKKTVELIEESPSPVNVQPATILAELFNPSDVINIQVTAYESGTLTTVEKLPELLENTNAKLSRYKFLNPAIFKKVGGSPNTKNKGVVTTRCNDNVKKRRYMVLENDNDDEAKVERFNDFAMTMAKFAPLVMAVDTGNKSVHYWFDTEGCKPTVSRSFFAIACLHGADKRLAVKSQIARMPNVPAAKEGRGKQTVVYYDPEGVNHPEEGKWNLDGFEEFMTANRQLDYFYYGEKGEKYYTRDDDGNLMILNRESTLVDLALKGFRKQLADGDNVPPAVMALNRIQREKGLSGVLKAAGGRHAGYYEENGEKFLVLSSPNIIKARRGKFPTIEKFHRGFFRNSKQYHVAMAMIQAMIRDLYNDGKRIAHGRQIQKLIIAGAPNAGKTLWKDHILSPCLGGRQASADTYFKENAPEQNREMFGADLLFTDDSPVFRSSFQFRSEYSEKTKRFVAGGGLDGYRAMAVDRMPIRGYSQMIRLMNQDPHHIATLPLLDEGVADKWVLFSCASLNDYWPEASLAGWSNSVERSFKKELPHFIHFMLHEYKQREEDKDKGGRYPVESFKCPEIISQLEEGSAESFLLHRFNHDAKNALFGDAFDDGSELTTWRGTADSLYDTLASTGTRSTQQRFMKVCPSPKILISQLRNLEDTTAGRVAYSERCPEIANRLNGSRYWQISPPLDKPDFSDLM